MAGRVRTERAALSRAGAPRGRRGGTLAWVLPRPRCGIQPQPLLASGGHQSWLGALVIVHDVCSFENGSQAALGGSWSMSLAPGFPRETCWLRFSAGSHAREELVESGPWRPRPEDWVRLLLSGEVTAGVARLPALRHLRREPAGREAAPGRRGAYPREGPERRRGGLGAGAGKRPSFPLRLPASRSGDWEVGDTGRGPRRDGGRGRAAFKSHWRTGPPEADK